MYFGLPKRSQNRAKIHSKSTSQKTCDFSSNFARKMLCCNSADIDFVLVFPILFACRALFFESLFECILVPKKPTKNQSKTTSEPFKNRCQKCVVFQHRFFRVSASILHPLGTPTWSQVGHFGYQRGRMRPSKSFLKLNVFKKWRLGRLWAGFWRPQSSILEPPGFDFGASSLDFEASKLDCGASRPPTFLCLCFPHSATPLGKRGTVSCLGFIPFVFLPSSTALPKCGRRRCPPLGAFNPPPTEGGAGRARP